MTKSVEQARRELFEAWADKDHLGRIGLEYENPYVESAWNGFKAALDAVVIELPKPMVVPFEQEFDGDYEAYQQAEGHCIDMNRLLGRCRAAIEATGLGIKTK